MFSLVWFVQMVHMPVLNGKLSVFFFFLSFALLASMWIIDCNLRLMAFSDCMGDYQAKVKVNRRERRERMRVISFLFSPLTTPFSCIVIAQPIQL